MNIWLYTRSRKHDYNYIGYQSLPQMWWKPYLSLTNTTEPWFIVDIDKNEWRCFLGGIPSNRSDSKHRIIRYAIIAQGPCDELDKLSLLCAQFLSERNQLQQKLNSFLTAEKTNDLVEQSIQNKSSAVLNEEEYEKLKELLLSQVTQIESSSSISGSGVWHICSDTKDKNALVMEFISKSTYQRICGQLLYMTSPEETHEIASSFPLQLWFLDESPPSLTKYTHSENSEDDEDFERYAIEPQKEKKKNSPNPMLIITILAVLLALLSLSFIF